MKYFDNRENKKLPFKLPFESLGDFRFLKFLMVGASGLVINNGMLVFFTETLGIHYLLSAIFATQFSTLWNFLFTEVWVFRDRNQRDRSRRLVRFFLMNNTALLLRGPLLTLMVSTMGIHYLLSNLATLFLIALIRFTISDRWIWIPPLNNKQDRMFAYNIHNIIGIESGIKLPELEYFLVPELDKSPDIRLRQERRRSYRPSLNSIHYKESLGRFGFECTIDYAECIQIQVSPLVRKSPHVLYTNIFEPVLRWVLVRKGYALVHAACIALENCTMLITARTDTGKTSTILKLLQKPGSRFLSDDMTILSKDGRVLNFPKPLTISLHTLSALQSTTLSFKEKAALQVQSRIHSRSGRRFALWLSRAGLPAASINAVAQILIPPPKYMISRLIPEVIISESSTLSYITQIEKGLELVEELDFVSVLNILGENAEDAYGFPPYPKIASELSKWKEQDLDPVEKQIVHDSIQEKFYYRLRDPSYGWWRGISDLSDDHDQNVPVKDDQ